MHAQPAVQRHGRCEPPRQRRGYPASSRACAGPAVLHHGDCGLLRQQRGYPASSHACAGPAVLHHGDCGLLRQRRGYPATSHACAGPAVQLHGDCGPFRQRRGYPASLHARAGPAVRHHCDCRPFRQRRGYPASCMHAKTGWLAPWTEQLFIFAGSCSRPETTAGPASQAPKAQRSKGKCLAARRLQASVLYAESRHTLRWLGRRNLSKTSCKFML